MSSRKKQVRARPKALQEASCKVLDFIATKPGVEVSVDEIITGLNVADDERHAFVCKLKTLADSKYIVRARYGYYTMSVTKAERWSRKRNKSQAATPVTSTPVATTAPTAQSETAKNGGTNGTSKAHAVHKSEVVTRIYSKSEFDKLARDPKTPQNAMAKFIVLPDEDLAHEAALNERMAVLAKDIEDKNAKRQQHLDDAEQSRRDIEALQNSYVLCTHAKDKGREAAAQLRKAMGTQVFPITNGDTTEGLRLPT